MKKLFTLLLLLFCIVAHSQNADSTHNVRKHEIGFGFTNLYNLFGNSAALASGSGYFLNNQEDYGPTGFDYAYGGGYSYGGGYYGDYYSSFNPGYGVSYKYHIQQKGAIRVGIDFSNVKTKSSGRNEYPGAVDTLYNYESHTSKLVTKVGYQFEKQIKRIMVFGGVDAFYYLKKNEYSIDGVYVASSISSEKGNSTISGFGIAPFGGVYFRINDLFSISTEGRFRLGSYTSKGTYSGTYSTIPDIFSGNHSATSFETKFSPLGLISFNIHL